MKKAYLILCCCLTVMAGSSQNLRAFISSNQQLIEEAVRDGVFVIRQHYQLKDDSQYYGRGTDAQFGVSYSLAVRTSTGYYVDDRAMRPWEYDANYDEYRGNVQLAPVLSKSGYRTVTSKTYLSFKPEMERVDTLPGNFAWFVHNMQFGGGFSKDTTGGFRKGWIVLLTSEEPLSVKDSTDFSFEIYRMDMDIREGITRYEITALSTERTIVGGIYIRPDITGVGQVSLSLTGIIRQIEKKWYIVALGTKENTLNKLFPVKN